jgi:hypothetical protein
VTDDDYERRAETLRGPLPFTSKTHFQSSLFVTLNHTVRASSSLSDMPTDMMCFLALFSRLCETFVILILLVVAVFFVKLLIVFHLSTQ